MGSGTARGGTHPPLFSCPAAVPAGTRRSGRSGRGSDGPAPHAGLVAPPAVPATWRHPRHARAHRAECIPEWWAEQLPGGHPHLKARPAKPDACLRLRERTRGQARRGRRGAEPRPCPGCRDGSVAAKRNDACRRRGAPVRDRPDKTAAGAARSLRPRPRQSRSAAADAPIGGNRGFLGPVGRRGSRRRV